jgi:hypothetical protein
LLVSLVNLHCHNARNGPTHTAHTHPHIHTGACRGGVQPH